MHACCAACRMNATGGLRLPYSCISPTIATHPLTEHALHGQVGFVGLRFLLPLRRCLSSHAFKPALDCQQRRPSSLGLPPKAYRGSPHLQSAHTNTTKHISERRSPYPHTTLRALPDIVKKDAHKLQVKALMPIRAKTHTP